MNRSEQLGCQHMSGTHGRLMALRSFCMKDPGYCRRFGNVEKLGDCRGRQVDVDLQQQPKLKVRRCCHYIVVFFCILNSPAGERGLLLKMQSRS